MFNSNQAPEYEPQRIKIGQGIDVNRKYQDGDSVYALDTADNAVPGVVLERLSSGRYRVKTSRGTVAVTEDEISQAVARAKQPGGLAASSSSSSSPPGAPDSRSVVNSIVGGTSKHPSAAGDVSSEVTPPPVQSGYSSKPPVQQSPKKSALDAAQTGLDAWGVVGDAVVPGSGVAADAGNAAISLMRAATDRKNSGTHLKNAAISAVSMIPFVGDLAKGFKYAGKGAKAARGVKSGDAVQSTSEFVANFLSDSKSESKSPRGGGRKNGVNDNPGDGGVGSGSGGGGGGDDDRSGTSLGEPDGGDGLEKSTKPLTDKLVFLTGVVGKVAVASYAASNSISIMNRAAIDYHRSLANFNGEIGAAFGKLEADRMQRTIRKGGELSGPLSGLAESQSKLEDVLQDLNSPYKVLAIDVQTGLTDMATIAMRILDKLEPITEIYVDYIRPKLQQWGFVKANPTPAPSTGWMDEIRRQARQDAKKPRKL